MNRNEERASLGLSLFLLILHLSYKELLDLPCELRDGTETLAFYHQYHHEYQKWIEAFQQNLVEVLEISAVDIRCFTAAVVGELDMTPLRNRLRALDENQRIAFLQVVVIAAVKCMTYDARSRFVVLRLQSALKVSQADFASKVESTLINTLEQVAQQNVSIGGRISPAKRWLYAGLGAASGAVILGLTAGLAAPIVMPAVAGLFGIGGLLGGAGGAALFTTLFGAAGAGLGGYKVSRRVADIDDFEILPLCTDERHMRTTLCISGWLTSMENVWKPWSRFEHSPNADVYVLKWESKILLQLGTVLENLIKSSIFGLAARQAVMRTALATAASALLWPVTLLQVGDMIDNPWSLGLDRAQKAGIVLADVIRSRAQGARPIDLIGFSLGALVIYSCLKELTKTAQFGLIENIVLMGLPATIEKHALFRMRCLVAGRFIHCYSRSDWILRFVYRTSQLALGEIAGLNPIEGVPGIESIDLSRHVKGHLEYDRFPLEIFDLVFDWV